MKLVKKIILLGSFLVILAIASFRVIQIRQVSAATSSPAVAAAYADPVCTGTNEESSIRKALQSDKCDEVGCWAITSWKAVLALANLGLVVILIFIAVVNILRIQYDTYAIKKALPILIIGVILANFSLLIVRMFVDFANILTALFTKNCTPGEFAANLITAADVGGTQTAAGFAGSGGMGLGTLLIWFLFALFVMVAFLILGFLFYIRYAVVIILAIVAPLAFIAMAFPPTQGFFKQWWGWLTKFIFMKPISFFLLYLAGEILKAGTDSRSGMTHLTLWIIVAFLVYLALIIPFKLGGVVMGAWGRAGQFVTGTGKGGYIRKPIANWAQRRYQDVGTWFTNRFPGIAGRSEWDKERTELWRKRAVAKARRRVEGKMGGGQARERRLTQEAEDNLKKLQEEHMIGVETGKLKHMRKFLWSTWLGKVIFRFQTGTRGEGELATRFKRSAADLQKATEAAQKSRQWDLFTLLGSDQRASNQLVSQYKKMLSEGNGLAGYDIDENNNLIFKGGDPEKTANDYKQDAMQLRRKAATEKDLEKQHNLYESADILDKRAIDWQNANHAFNGEILQHSVLLDTNLKGRILKLITPLLIDEQHTFAQNTNLDGFEAILEGKKDGGFGELTHDLNDLSNIMLRKYSKFESADPINAAVCTLGALREKMAGSPSTTESQAFTALAFREAAKILASDSKTPEGKEWWGRMLEHLDSTEGGMPGLIAGVAIEESRDQIKRGEKPIIDNPQSYLEGTRVDVAKVYNENDWEELIKKITPEMIGTFRLTTGDHTTRYRREFFNRARTAFFQQPEFAGGENPANIGSIVEDQPLFTTLKRRSPTPPASGYQPPPEEPPAGPLGGPAQAAQSQAAALWESPDATTLAQVSGGYTKAAEKYVSGAELLRTMGEDLARHFRVPSGVKLDTNSLNQLIRRLSGLKVDLDIDRIEAELRTINPEITLDRNVSVADYVTQAQRITKGSDNYAELAIGTLADDCFPYVKGAVKKNNDELADEISKLTVATETLADAAGKFIESGGRQGIDDESIKKIVGPIEQLRGGGISLNSESLKQSLRQGSFGPMNEILDKYSLVLRALQKLKSAPSDQQLPLTAPNIKKAIIEAVQESALERRQTEAPSTTAPPPPPTEQPPGGGEVPPVGAQ